MRKTDFLGRVIRFFKYNPWWLRLVDWSKTHSLPGLKRIPLYNLISFIDRELKEDALITRANSMSFSFFLALFPATIVMFTLLAYTPLYDQFGTELEQAIHEIMPNQAGNTLFKIITDIATIQRGGLLSAGFLLALWFASNGMLSMMRGLEKDYNVTFKRRKPLEKRLIALQLTFLVGLVLVASVVFVIMGRIILEFVFRFIHADFVTKTLLFAFRWVVVLLLFYSTFSTIYRFGSSTRRPISFFNPGALLATVLSIVTSWGFSFYVDNFGNYNQLYGSIGTLIVLMLWLQLNCMILLIGFELNAGIAVLRDMRKKKDDEGQETTDIGHN